MKRQYGLMGIVIMAWLINVAESWAGAPAVSNVIAGQVAHTKLVNITYDLPSDLGAPLIVSLLITTNGPGNTNYDLYIDEDHKITNFSGNGYGTNVTPGAARQIVWDAGADLGAGHTFRQVTFHVMASDGNSPTGFVLIPAGSFTMGGASDYPATVHTVYVSNFYMEVAEVTCAQWADVYQWATNNGYSFDHAGGGTGAASNWPVFYVDWYDTVKWCNARTEKELGIGSLACCYYTSPAFTAENIYRSGQTNISTNCVNWSTNGYRLPTEAEWEKASRGGGQSNLFPWADANTITYCRANYSSRTNELPYDVSPIRGRNPRVDPTYQKMPVGSFSTNGYGLYDMAGNVAEWCWDVYANYSSATVTNPYGPAPSATTTNRIRRGSDPNNYASSCRNANRMAALPPTDYYKNVGFRCVRGQ